MDRGPALAWLVLYLFLDMSMAVRLHIRTFGCQMNKLDSELLAGNLMGRGFELGDDAAGADVVIFNTCSVRQHAENLVLTQLGRLAELKASKPGLIAALVGCMAQRQGWELLEKFPALDIVCGPGELHRLEELISKARKGAGRQSALTGRLRSRREIPEELEELDAGRDPGQIAGRAQAYVRVMRGCDKFCSYCIVPAVRGREISRPPEHIRTEVEKLVSGGCVEITLLGQTVNSYCHRANGREVRFAELLRSLGEVGGLERLRFVTSHPSDFSDDIFRAMAQVPAVCEYLHGEAD